MRESNKVANVAHILNEICFSGAETMLKDAGPVFCGYGFKLYAVSTGRTVGEYAPILEKGGFEIKHMPFKKSIKFFVELSSFLKKENIDVVHIHTERAFFWYALTAKISGVKNVVRTIHNVFNFKGRFLKAIRRLQRFFSRKFLGVKFLSIGKSVEEVERQNFKNKTVIIHNWVDRNKFYPPINDKEKINFRSKLNINLNAFVIISVGACIATKNHSDVIRSLSFINNKSVLDKLVYLHVGDGILCNEEQNLSKDLGLTKNTIFYGKTDRVRDLMIASDIFIMTSHYEGLPIALLEAMSCELPTVAYNASGVRDLITDGSNGILVKSNPSELALAIEEIMQNEGLKKLFGSNARQFVEKNYNMQNSVKQMIKQYGYENNIK